MAKTKKAPKKAKQPKSFILTISLLLLMGSFAVALVGYRHQYKEGVEELQQKNAVLEQLTDENARKEEIKNNPDKSAYYEQLAREKGYALPGEKVFFDATPGA